MKFRGGDETVNYPRDSFGSSGNGVVFVGGRLTVILSFLRSQGRAVTADRDLMGL